MPKDLTENEASISAALEQAGGFKTGAAEILGVTLQALERSIQKSPRLAARWKKDAVDSPQAPGHAITIHRPVIPAIGEQPIKSDLEVAAALEKEERDFKSGFKAIGFNQEQVNLAAGLQQFQRKSYRSGVEMVSGGIIKQYFDILQSISKIDARLNGDDSGEKLPIAEEMMLRNDRSNLYDISIKLKAQVDKYALIAARVKQMESDGKGGGAGKPRKPGFRPLEKGNTVAVQAQPGSIVHVHPPEE